jgi:sec-independent protein translocase protein TatA
MLRMIGPWEIALILFIVLMLFGPKRLPEMGKAIGDTIKELRRSAKELHSEEEPFKNSDSAR